MVINAQFKILEMPQIQHPVKSHPPGVSQCLTLFLHHITYSSLYLVYVYVLVADTKLGLYPAIHRLNQIETADLYVTPSIGLKLVDTVMRLNVHCIAIDL